MLVIYSSLPFPSLLSSLFSSLLSLPSPSSLFSLSPSLLSLSSLFPFPLSSPLSSLSLLSLPFPSLLSSPSLSLSAETRALGFTCAAVHARRRRRARAIEVEEARERGERTYGAGTTAWMTAAHGGEDRRGEISAAWRRECKISGRQRLREIFGPAHAPLYRRYFYWRLSSRTASRNGFHRLWRPFLLAVFIDNRQ